MAETRRAAYYRLPLFFDNKILVMFGSDNKRKIVPENQSIST